MSNDKIRPDLGEQRRPFEVGQVWAVDGESIEWFVLTPRRVIALFAGASDHTPQTLVFHYGDRLYLKQTATVYADMLAAGKHAFTCSDERNEDYLMLCATCGETPLAEPHMANGVAIV